MKLIAFACNAKSFVTAFLFFSFSFFTLFGGGLKFFFRYLSWNANQNLSTINLKFRVREHNML